MARINKTKYALLGALSMEPGSGYDIKKFCDLSISHFWRENYGHIYPVLKSLEKDGLATRETEFTKGKPARNVYFINKIGRQVLRDWLINPVEEDPIRSELLLKMFFSGDLSLENIKNKMQACIVKNKAKLETYHQIESKLRSKEPYRSQKKLPLWLATVNHGKYDAQYTITWCEETLKTIEFMRSEKDEDFSNQW